MSNGVQSKSHTKIVLLILLFMAVMATCVMYFNVIQPRKHHSLKSIKINGIYLSTPKTIKDFQLTDNHGNIFTKENLKGHWTMMFFGFTNCGMVCPTTMAALNKMYVSMQKNMQENQLPQVVMVSVDPDRDSVKRMNDYVTSFNPHFIGARAEIAPTVALEKQLNIAAAKIQSEGGKDHYTIDHSAEILLFNPDANLQAYMSYPHEPDQMINDYKLILATTISS